MAMKNIFYNIDENNKQKLLTYLEAHYMKFSKNTNISLSLQGKNLICIITEGYIQIIKNDYNGNRNIIEELDNNDVFGSILSSINSKNYEILSKEDTSLIVLDYNIINSKENISLPYYNQFIKNLLEIYQEKINKNNDRIEILSNKTIRDKLLTYFKQMTNGINSKIIYLPSTFTDLADYLGVNRSAMERELTNLKKEGLIEIKDKKIRLLYYM